MDSVSPAESKIISILTPKQRKLYIYKDTETAENTYQRDVYLEIFGEEGHTRWDARYEILIGDLLVHRSLTERSSLRLLMPSVSNFTNPLPMTQHGNNCHPSAQSLGSENLDLAKEAFLQRGYFYVRQEDGLPLLDEP